MFFYRTSARYIAKQRNTYMITILNRIFPEDISFEIYNFAIKCHVDTIVYGKIYNITLIMENIIRKHQNNISRNIYILTADLAVLRLINNNLIHIYNKFVIKKHYVFSDDTKNILAEFLKCLNETKNDQQLLINVYVNKVYNDLIHLTM